MPSGAAATLEQIQLRRAEEPKNCRACGKPLVRREGERNDLWRRRIVCDSACRMKSMRTMVRALDAQKIELRCGKCGASVLRSSRFKNSHMIRCYSCLDAFRQQNATAKREARREEARRYRVLMTALGFEDFAELLAYLKQVPWVELDGRRMRNLYAEAVR